MSQELALNCRAGGADQCPKLGVERTQRRHAAMAVSNPYLKSTLQSRAANAIRRMPCVRTGDQLPLSFHRAHLQEPGEALVIVQQELDPAAATAAVLP